MRYSSHLLALAALAFLAACSHASSDSSSAGATAAATDAAAASASAESASTPGQGTTITTDKGAVTLGGSVDPAKLGVPIYPGATQAEGGMSVSSANGSGAVAQFKTNDSFDKVYDYYKSQLPSDSEKVKVASSMVMFKVENTAGGDTVVQITAGQGFTAVTITHSLKK